MSFTYAICTIQRSGSNMLCDILTKADCLGKPFECFDPRYEEETEFSDPFEKIINTRIAKGKTLNGVIGIKLMYDHLPRLTDLINQYQHTKFNSKQAFELCKINKHIYLYRENKVRQAISLYKAKETKIWRDFPGNINTHKTSTLHYNKLKIQRCLNRIRFRENQWNAYFKNNQIFPLKISYEELVEDRQNTLKKVFNYLDNTFFSENLAFPETNLVKQSDYLSEAFYERFLEKPSFFKIILFYFHNFLHLFWLKWEIKALLILKKINPIKKLKRILKAIVPLSLEGYYTYFSEYYRHRGRLFESITTIDYHGKKVQFTYSGFIKNKCIFFHIPKTAGISVSLSLFGHLSRHVNAQFYKCLFGKSFETHFKFAFVRNPYTRLVSAYEYLKNTKDDFFKDDLIFKKNVLDKYKTFDDFVRLWLKDNFKKSKPHFRPQFSFISVNGNLILDFLGRFESLEQDFEVICKHLNIQTTLQKENISRYNKVDYLNTYYSNPETVAIVQQIYKDDFNFLGYSTDITQIQNE